MVKPLKRQATDKEIANESEYQKTQKHQSILNFLFLFQIIVLVVFQETYPFCF